MTNEQTAKLLPYLIIRSERGLLTMPLPTSEFLQRAKPSDFLKIVSLTKREKKILSMWAQEQPAWLDILGSIELIPTEEEPAHAAA